MRLFERWLCHAFNVEVEHTQEAATTNDADVVGSPHRRRNGLPAAAITKGSFTMSDLERRSL